MQEQRAILDKEACDYKVKSLSDSLAKANEKAFKLGQDIGKERSEKRVLVDTANEERIRREAVEGELKRWKPSKVGIALRPVKNILFGAGAVWVGVKVVLPLIKLL